MKTKYVNMKFFLRKSVCKPWMATDFIPFSVRINAILNDTKCPMPFKWREMWRQLGTDCQGIVLTHWGRAMHICVGYLTIIGSDNGLSHGRRQTIIWTIAGILLIGPLGTNFSEISIGIQTFSFKKMHLKMSSAKWRPFVSASVC